jgi:hypothetical protein
MIKSRRMMWAWNVARMGGNEECLQDIDEKARKYETTGKNKA